MELGRWPRSWRETRREPLGGGRGEAGASGGASRSGAAVTATTAPPRHGRIDGFAARLGLDRVELGALVVLSGLSVLVLAMLSVKGRPLSGADGLLASDQLQYFAWIREASHHLLAGDRFDLAPGGRSFLHPGFAVSGALHALGLSIPLSYLVWKPLAVALTFVGVLRYVRRLLPAGGRRHAALLLALFAVMPAG